MRPTEFPKTLQEIFNIVWERAKDKRKSNNWDYTSTSPGCKYRLNSSDPTSLACFIGECIPDAMYTISFEEKSIHTLLTYPEYKLPVGWGSLKTQLGNLQDIHDDYHPILWEIELTNFAKRNNLTIPQ